MGLLWYERNQEAVAEALRDGQRPDMATTMNSGPLDDLVALHDELGVFEALGELVVHRQRRGVDDQLLLRTVAVLPFLDVPSLSGAAELLFRDPAVLLHLGWSALQIRIGDNYRHRNPAGRKLESLPCHPETLRDELRRIGEEGWLELQQKVTTTLFEGGFVRGGVYAIDGTGLGDGLRLVSLVCVSSERPKIVAWRVLEGTASEKGKEALVTRSLLEQAIQMGGEGCIELLLVDALYADGPLLAWCKYAHAIDVLVPLPSSREIHHDMEQLASAEALNFERYSYVRTIQGHKQRRTVDLGIQNGVTCWDSFVAAAQQYGDEAPQLWACYVRPVNPTSDEDAPWTLASTRPWISGVAAYEAFRPRWHIENDAYRELKEGWGLEAERWGRDIAVQRGRITLTCLAFNTAQVYLSALGRKSAARGIRRLRRYYEPNLGHSPVVIFLGPHYAVFPVEELLQLTGRPTKRSLQPQIPLANPP